MKKIFKSRVFAFVLGALIFGSIGVVSAYTILANDIGYTPKDSTWKKSNGEDITNVKDAIDELYSKANNQKESTQVATLATQGATYTMQNDGYVIGTMRTGNGAAGAIYFNQSNHDELVGAVAIAPSNYNNDVTVSVYASKNTIISTRTGWGTYNLTVYEWK